MGLKNNFLLKSIFALTGLALGIAVVAGAAWLSNEYYGLKVPSALRNIFGVALGLFIFQKIVGKELEDQFKSGGKGGG